MSTPVHIPRPGIGVTECTLLSWLVADGDVVAVGTPIYLLETEKVENEIEATAAGAIRCIGVAGETYPVGTLVAEIG